jgi:tetratricopeptide (TPR) repeat protein
VSEAVSYIREAYEVAERLGNSRLRAFVLLEYGGIEMRRTNHERAASLIQEALRLSELHKDKHVKAHCLLKHGRTATRQGQHDLADQYGQQSLQILRDLSDRSCTMECLFHLGWNAYLAGETSRALKYLDECYSIAQDMDFNEIISVPAFALGRIAVMEGDVPKARGLFLEALQAHKKSPDSPYFLAYCLEAVCAIPGISPGQAARLLGTADAIREKRGFITPGAERPLIDAIIETLQSQLGKAVFDSARAAGKAVSARQAIDDAIDALQVIV